MKLKMSTQMIALLLITSFVAAPSLGANKKEKKVKAKVELFGGEAGQETLDVLAFDHEVISPRDAASGLPTGKRQHKPFTLTLPGSSNTVGHLAAMVKGAAFKTLEILVSDKKRDPSVSEEVIYKVVLESPVIVSVRKVMDLETSKFTEVIQFEYTRITESWTDGGVTASDTWNP